MTADSLDRREFVDLLKKMLWLEQEVRLTPSEGLTHSFLLLTHLVEHQNSCMYEVIVQYYHAEESQNGLQGYLFFLECLQAEFDGNCFMPYAPVDDDMSLRAMSNFQHPFWHPCVTLIEVISEDMKKTPIKEAFLN